MRQAKIYNYNIYAGILTEDENGYTFQYDENYLQSDYAQAISLTLPLTNKPYIEKILFPFFDGLIPEGWLLDIAEKSWSLTLWQNINTTVTCRSTCLQYI